jgi:molybdopterin molybdotransferase
MISFREAQELIAHHCQPLSSETVPIFEAHHRVLAEDVVAECSLPPFDNSSMDGFAFRSSDTQGYAADGLVRLRLAGEVSAGTVQHDPVAPGTAVRVMTGAPLPPGADTILEQELVQVVNGSIRFSGPVLAGRNIRRVGDDIQRGEAILKRGERLCAAHLGVLASIGRKELRVVRRPTVAIVTTGNELVEIDEPLRPGKIRNSNLYSLWGLVKEQGAQPILLPTTSDDERALTEVLTIGLQSDVLLTSGGVSVGKYDLVLKALEKMGVEIVFWKVNIKPGMPVAFGISRQRERTTRVFALPGNPVSTMVTFFQFARPALTRLEGEEIKKFLTLRAILDQDIEKKDAKRHFSRGVARNENGKIFVRTTGSQNSGVLTSMVAANCLIILPEDVRTLKKGDEVQIEMLRTM